jgi:hypothetical protein
VRRATSFVATMVAGGSLLLGVGIAVAAGKTHAKPNVKIKPMFVKCSLAIATQPPAGSNTVEQPPQSGNQYGPMSCGRKGFGGGIASDSFNVPDSGDTVGKYTAYFHNGSITGKFDLTPDQSGPLDVNNFTAQTWTGTITVTGGTGVFKGIRSMKASGKLNCSTPDSVHVKCTERIKLLPALGSVIG